MKFRVFITVIVVLLFSVPILQAQQTFVIVKNHQFFLNNKPYYYIGTNYWYGSYLGLQNNPAKGIDRLRKELDFLKSKGITNVRVAAAVEGSGQINGVQRVENVLQTKQGVFNTNVLKGLDVLLTELDKRKMKAVLFLSNNWEWTGGFLQYLNWNGLITDSTVKRKLSWDEMRDYVSKFYSCEACKEAYATQLKLILNHTNSINGKKYKNDAAIMAWELANEPRPMRASAIDDCEKWISSSAALIKSIDKNHLVTTGCEGEQGTESMEVFKTIHADKNIDYATIHIWPKNWGWFKDTSIAASFNIVMNNTTDYINKHIEVARLINKPLVVEEFGLPRDGHSFDINATTSFRDKYYDNIFSIWNKSKQDNDVLAGCSFWAYSGMAKPIAGQTYWKHGDDYMGDPPMEEQGLNSVFNSDSTTWNIIMKYK
jgi:mannan endo-1,4-beta-mannosidase